MSGRKLSGSRTTATRATACGFGTFRATSCFGGKPNNVAGGFPSTSPKARNTPRKRRGSTRPSAMPNDGPRANMTKRLLGVAALLAVALGLRDSNLAAPAPPELYVFVQDLDRVVGVRRGGWIIYGQLNADGELIADGKHQIGAPIHLPRWTNHV